MVAQELNREHNEQPKSRALSILPTTYRSRSRRELQSLFCEYIAMERFPIDARLPTSLPRYDSSTAPQQHLLAFEHLMELHSFN